MSTGRVGVIAGEGTLPHEAARCLAAAGTPTRFIAFEGVGTQAGADATLRLGQVEALADYLEREGVERLLLVGSFDPRLLEGAAFVPDAEGRALTARFEGQSWVAWMQGIADWLAARGFELCRQDELLRSLLAPAGMLSGADTGSEREALEAAVVVGRAALEAGADDDLAQAVAVRDGRVVALEGEDGTDALIERAGAGAVIVKAARRGQDPRLDLPAIGPGTVAALVRAGARGLAVEAGRTLVLERARFETAAQSASLSVLGFERAGRGS